MLETSPWSFKRYPITSYIFPSVLDSWFLKLHSSQPYLLHSQLYYTKLTLLYLLWLSVLVMEQYRLLTFRIITYAKGVKVPLYWILKKLFYCLSLQQTMFYYKVCKVKWANPHWPWPPILLWLSYVSAGYSLRIN